MKRVLVLVLGCAFLLSGCGLFGERMKEPVTFYYLRAEYAYGSDSSVFVPEEREASGHRNDLSYLMALYLMGPTEEEACSPVPRGVRFLKTESNSGKVTLTLSELADTMSDSEFTLMSACLTMTCLDMMDAQQVTVKCLDRSVTMTRESLTLSDQMLPENTEETK